MKKIKVFISWSGARSRQVAEALHGWLPLVINNVSPWISTKGVAPGQLTIGEVLKNLEEMELGIICLTPENRGSTWLHFEAGILSKLRGESRVCTYLFDLEPVTLERPLSEFQHSRANEVGTRGLVHAINEIQERGEVIPEDQLDTAFNNLYPLLREKLNGVAPGSPAAPRPDRELLEEILITIKGQQSRPFFAKNRKEFPLPRIYHNMRRHFERMFRDEDFAQNFLKLLDEVGGASRVIYETKATGGRVDHDKDTGGEDPNNHKDDLEDDENPDS